MFTNIYFWFHYDLGQKYQAPKVRLERVSNSWPPDAHRSPGVDLSGDLQSLARLSILHVVYDIWLTNMET